MTYVPAKFEAAMSIGLGEIFDMKHCPLHNVTYVPAKFEVATAKG